MPLPLRPADVALDTVGSVTVSTRYFGLGRPEFGDYPYWETAVYPTHQGWDGYPTAHDDLWDRYDSRDAAVEGHARVLAAVTTREGAA